MKQNICFLFLIILIISLVESRRIAGGSPVGPGVLTWHVKLEPSNGSFRRLCGGALIKFNWVLTAGQCISNARDVIIRLGVTDRLQGAEPAIFWVRNRDHIIVHENYTDNIEKPGHKNDIGLVYLEEATEDILNIFDQDTGKRLISAVSLPLDMNVETVGKTGVASGFGFYTDGPDAIQSMNLQMVDMVVIDLDVCKQKHVAEMISDGNLCTDTKGGRSTCLGDEGAPLVAIVEDEVTLIGIGSTALQLCTVEIPAIFTNVVSYLDWISNEIDEDPVTDPSTTDDPNATTPAPPDSGKCNCVCNCFTCPPVPIEPTKSKTKINYFWKK